MTKTDYQWINLVPAISKRFGFERIENLRVQDSKNSITARLPTECKLIELHQARYTKETFIYIPEEVRSAYEKYRPTPLYRAKVWEEHLGSKTEIWLKREDLTPSGSHKYNTALAQAIDAKSSGAEGIVADTGAGQWGVALAMACSLFGLKCVIFMPRQSYERKAGRRLLMEAAGAEVYCSPSELTETGQAMRNDSVRNPLGRLSEAMSEAHDFALKNPSYLLGQGCLSFYAPLHQTIIGVELERQLADEDIEPDLMVACAGGGTNSVGFLAPWLLRAIEKMENVPEMRVVEPAEVPALTKGEYRLDSPDAQGLGDKLQMYTLGSGLEMPDIDAAGLRYHAKSPLLSFLRHENFVSATSVNEEEAREAGLSLFRSEGILAAPESAHALAAVARELRREEFKYQKVVVCLSGSGILDGGFYIK